MLPCFALKLFFQEATDTSIFTNLSTKKQLANCFFVPQEQPSAFSSIQCIFSSQFNNFPTCSIMDDDSYSKKRKGGLQQRLSAAKRQSVEDSGVDKPSLLSNWLQQQWAWGRFSPQEIQHIAMLAKRDSEAAGATHLQKPLCSLASLGTEGMHGNNCHRDLLQVIKDVSFLPQPLSVFMPFKITAKTALQSIMLPHLVFHHLWVSYKDYWNTCFVPNGQKGLEVFWKNFQFHPAMQGHCILHRANWKRTTIPLSLHGDAVPTVGCGKVWAKLIQAFSWGGLLSIGSTKQRSFFIWGDTSWLSANFFLLNVFVFFSALKQQTTTCTLVAMSSFPQAFEQLLQHGQDSTLGVFFQVLKWSFTALLSGKFPQKDWEGNLQLA